jgi:hypothetical protein
VSIRLWVDLLLTSILDGRVIETRDILLSPKEMTEMISRRADKPKEGFADHGPPIRWTALGDSYTAGPGAGNKRPDRIKGCKQTDGSYAYQLSRDFPWDVEQKLEFLACTGHKIMM